MKNEKITKIIILISIVFFIVGLGIIFPNSFGLCNNFQKIVTNSISYGCEAWYTHKYGTLAAVLVLFSPILFLTSLLMFVKVKSKEIFNSWKHFALWWLPLSAFFIFIASPTGGDGFGLDGMIDREIVTWWFAGLFLLISLILITYKSIKLRGK